MKKIDLPLFAYTLDEKESVLFDRINNPDPIGMLLHAMIKKHKLRRALLIGTGDWFRALCMAHAGAWVVTLSDKPTLPTRNGVLTAYKDKVFQVVQSPKEYLTHRESRWDIICTDEEDTSLYMDIFNKFLVTKLCVYEK